MKKIIIYCLIHLCCSVNLSGQVLEFQFKNTFNESCNLVPALIPLCNDIFYTDSLPDFGGMQRTVYGFANNCGIHFDNTISGDFIGKGYSIELYFKLDSSITFSRIIDFKNRSSDQGLYCTENILQFYNAISTPTNAFASGQYVHLILTRDSASQLVSEYVNGQLLDSFTDTNELAITDTSNILSFFQDDLVFGNEANSGAIAMLKIYNSPLDSIQVATAYNNLSITLAPNSFEITNTSSCLSNNNFSFINNSPDTALSTYRWYFGDGDSLYATHAQHTYAGSGAFQVLMIAVSPAGCLDTVYDIVTIFQNPQPNLGIDLFLCNQDSLTLDPGVYNNYFWNDGSNLQQLITAKTGKYWVFVLDSNGCIGSDTINIGITPSISLGGDTAICNGSVINLDAGAGASFYLWSNGSTLQNIAIADSGIYFITVTDSNGCSNSDTINIGFLAPPQINLGNDTVICPGSSITLDAGIAVAYLWQDGSTNQTFTTDSSGIYSVAITSLLGCTNFDSIEIVIIQPPAINLGGDSIFCGTINYSLNAGSGFNGYLWNDGSSLSTLTILDSGLYAVTVTDGNGCQGTDSVVLEIAASPIVSLGNDTSFCYGNSLMLNAGSGFIQYLWNNGSSLASLTAVNAGIYAIQVTDTNGCQTSDSIGISLTQDVIFSLGSDTAFCFGNSITLHAGAGFSNYVWNDGSSAQTLTVNGTGIYTVEVTDTIGCKGSDSVTVTVNLLPFTPIIFIMGGNTILSNQPFGNQWYDANGIINGATDSSYIPTQAGSYYTIVTDSNGCQSYPSNIIILGLGISDLSDTEIKIFPNPVKEKLEIGIDLLTIEYASFNILDMSGRLIKSVFIHEGAKGFKSFSIDVSELKSGMYILQLNSESQGLMVRFAKF